MSSEFWMYTSAIIVAISGVYYAIRAWQKLLFPNPVSWGIWAIVGVALFLTAEASEAGAVYLTTIVGAWNPFLIAVVIVIRAKDKLYTLSLREKRVFALALIGYAAWFMTRELPEVAPWAMYWMLFVDLLALWPTVEQLAKKPLSDKPFPWIIFGWGFGIAGFAITEHTVANWALPVYMFVAANLIAVIMIVPRVRAGVPLREWL